MHFHREADYHDALALKLKSSELDFEDQPDVLITLDNGEVVKTRQKVTAFQRKKWGKPT